MKQRVLFVDRDGTLIEEPADFQVDSTDKVRLMPAVIPALTEIVAAGYRLVMVSNQDGLGTSAFPKVDFDAAHELVMHLFASQGIEFDAVFICPHLPEDRCECRKPRTGLLTRYLAEHAIDTAASAVIGDRETDVQLAERLGLRSFRIGGESGLGWNDIAVALCRSERVAAVRRKTTETDIAIDVNLDAPAVVQVDTGIGFFDHMLEQIARHGGFGLVLRCTGDYAVDEHHTVEDTAICLGEAIRQALGEKRGIGRYGFLLPMDESEARVSLDLSGRAAFSLTADFRRERVGELSTEMVEHFFRSLAASLGAALHIEVRGDNAHHMIEACFKGVGRVLRQAVALSGGDIPSSKGTLSG